MKFLLMSVFLTLAGSAFGQSFVKASGTKFTLDGKPFYFQGSNAYDSGLMTGTSEQSVYDRFQKYADAGVKVVRIWGFSCGNQQANPIIQGYQNGRVVYNENSYRRMDLAVDAARRAHVRLILPLVNFEPSVCGIDWWVKEVIGKEDKQLFYTDSTVRTAYKSYVNNILNRVNTRTKARTGKSIRYKNDPTFLAIEMMNEPHTVDDYERSRGQRPGEMVYNWLSMMSTYIRGIDNKHLLSTGEEGYKTSHDGITSRHEWIHNGLKGVDFARNVKLPNINFVTVHIYPDNWGIPSSDFGFVQSELISDRAKIAHAAGKPIVLEESGFSRDNTFDSRGYNSNPKDWLQKVYAAANNANYAGTMVWQVVPNGFSGGYNFNFDDDQFAVIKNQVKYMNGKNGKPATGGQCSNNPPDNRFTCAEQAGWGKCGESFMVNFCNASCGRCK